MDDLQLIDGFLRGELSGDALASFTSRLASDPGLAAALADQRAVEAALRSAWAPPAGPPDALMEAVDGAEADPIDLPTGHTWVVSPAALVIAAILILVGGMAAYWWFLRGTPAPTDPAGIYQSAVAAGFSAELGETDPVALRMTIRSKLGRDWNTPQVPGVEYLGIGGRKDGRPGLSVYARVRGNAVLLLLSTAVDGTADSGVTTTRLSGGLYRHEWVRSGVRCEELSQAGQSAFFNSPSPQ